MPNATLSHPNIPVMEQRKKVLIIDDEKGIREALSKILATQYEVFVAEDGEAALTNLQEQSDPDIILLDVLMPGMSGISALEKIKQGHPKIPVIMITASNNVKSAVDAMKLGAVDYLNKPYDVDELLSLMSEALESGASGRTKPTDVQTHKLRPSVAEDFGCLVGDSPAMSLLYEQINIIAASNATVLVTGQSGTGKELVAKEIHNRSPRKEKPFVAINCAAIPETLIESELFGHVKGAFTHAVDKRIGHCEEADGGSLFLDEIGELSHGVQVKLLRFLQEQEFYPVGSSTPKKVDVRIIAATNRNLEQAIKEQQFREDLYYRINVVSLKLPSLCERSGDIPKLLTYFAGKIAKNYNREVPEFSKEAFEILQSWRWPGNVRELENVTESILALSTGEVVEAADIPARLKTSSSNNNLASAVVDGNLCFEEAEKEFETEIIVKALKKTNYVQTRAAELLGISRRILKYKMDKLGISEDKA